MIPPALLRRLDAAAAALAARATPEQVRRNGLARLYRGLEFYRRWRRSGDLRRAAEDLVSLAAVALVLAGELDPPEVDADA